MARLIINPTSLNRREVPIARSTVLTIGRDPSNDLVLPDSMVSRRHAVIEYRGSQFFLRDCNSANGSVVNGHRVSERGLRDGDLVAIGSMRLLFRDDPAAEPGAKVVPHPSAAPLHCPSCGAEFRRGDLYCRQCGAQVAQPSGPPRTVCPSCGSAVPLPARFCSACGGALEVETPDPSGEPRTPLPEGEILVTRPVPVETPERGAAVAASAPDRAAVPERRPAETPETAPTTPERDARTVATASPPRARAQARVVEPAGFGVRLVAGLVDAVFVVAVQSLLVGPVAWYWLSRETPQTPADVPFLPVLATAAVTLLALLVGAGYHGYFWTARGATPGKALFDLRVEGEDGTRSIAAGRAVMRLFGYALSAGSLGIGFLMIAVTGSGLHDRVAGTRVVRERRL